MDIVSDMDDLLNELEAAEMTGKLKYDENDPVINPKMILLDTSNNFSDKRNTTTSFLHNDHIEEAKNVHSVDIETTNVLTDLITSVSLNENDNVHCNVELESNDIIEQITDIPECPGSENSISAKNVDITHDCKDDSKNKLEEILENGIALMMYHYDSLLDRPSSYFNVILNECTGTNSEELTNKVTDEMDGTAEQYAEMEQYLASYETHDTTLDFPEQQYLIPNTEDSSIFPSTKTSEEEIITQEEIDRKKIITLEEETDRKSLSHEVDSDGNFRLASELEKETDEGMRNTVIEKIIKDATSELDASSCTNIDEHSVDEVSVDTGEDSDLGNVQKNVDVDINGSVTPVEYPSSSCCTQLSSTAEDLKETVSAVEKSDDKIGAESRGNDSEEEKQPELVEDDSDHYSECEILVPAVDEAQAISVVSSTYDISSDSGVKYLTESERQLGKKKPIWIDDKETLSCMICCVKFTVFVRRHHCRCCGRVLCARCTTHKTSLPYINNPKKEHRVCDPCFETLKRIEESEKNLRTDESANTNEHVHSSDISPATKPVLKSRAKPESISASDDQGSSSNDAARGSSAKRSVTFRDGLHPGCGSNETETSTAGSKSKKHDSKRPHKSWRLQQLHVTEECVCLLPNVDIASSNIDEASETDSRFRSSENKCLYLRNSDGTITECDNILEQITSLKNFEPVEVMIFRNFSCKIKLCKYGNKTVMCIISNGMSFVGLDEIFLAYYCNDELTELPIDYLWRIYEIYQHALTFRNESSDEELGIRLAHNRVPALNQTVRFANFDKPVARDILLFRPSIQTFENLLVPSSSFLVGIFIYQSESIWANVIPQRLLFRLGLQDSVYPTSIINDFNREPVYNSIFDASVLKIFNDFRNWRFQMPIILGSTLMVCDDTESILIIPTWALEEIIKLIKANKNMIAWGLDFSPDADSYLVCKQDDAGCFNSQIFTNGVENRKVTGASFIVIDGALKDGGEPFAVNVLEDGMAIRFRSDIMESLLEALSVGQDFEQISSAMKFSIKWNDDSYTQQFVGGLVSPIDNRSLIGCYQYGLKKSKILGSSYPIPNQVDWSLRLISVYNVAKGRFVQRVQSKVLNVSEQVAAQIATTLAPFITALIEHDLRHIFFRIRITTEDAEYRTQPWPGMEKEFAAWTDFLDYQIVPCLFTVCSYITVGFHAELHMGLISVRPNP